MRFKFCEDSKVSLAGLTIALFSKASRTDGGHSANYGIGLDGIWGYLLRELQLLSAGKGGISLVLP